MDRSLLMGVVSAASLMTAAPVMATDSNWYLGVGAGRSDFDSPVSSSQVDAALATSGITSSTSIDDTDTGWKLFGGYQINKNFAIELGYVDLGELDFDISISAPSAGSASGSIEVDGVAISALGILPISDNFGIFGRVGAYTWDASADLDVTVTGVGTVSVSDDDDGTDFFWGLGAKYDFMNNVGVRVEWERYDVDGEDVDLMSASLLYSF